MWRDRIVGIILGILLGIGIVAVFVFVYSQETIDAPSISSGGTAAGGGHRHNAHRHNAHRHKPQAVEATVQVLGGAPPESGPTHVDAHEGDTVTLTVNSDAAVTLQLIGYGITRSVQAQTPTPIRFKADQTGNFALINVATHIAVAQLRVDPR